MKNDKPEAGSMRPAYLKDCVKEGVDCGCVGTCKFQPRPEMPPAKEIMKQTIFTQIPHAEGKCSGCLNVTYEAGDDKVNIFCNQCGAASVQQEPLSAEYVDLLLRFRELGAVRLSPSAAEQDEMEDLLDALKSQPAAPRTQGREPGLSDEQLLTSAFDGMFYPVDDAAWGVKHNQHIEEILSRMAQVRTQPACPTDDELMELAKEFHRTQGELYETFMGLRDFYKFVHERFFTALPEATKKEG